MNFRKMLAWRRKRKGSAGWVIAVIFLGFIIFAFIYTELSFVADQVNSFVGSQPSFSGAYDPSTNSFMDLLFFTGLGVMVAFGAIVELINLTQKRNSGEEVI